MSLDNNIGDVNIINDDDKLEDLENKIKTIWNVERFALDHEKSELLQIAHQNKQEIERLEKVKDEIVSAEQEDLEIPSDIVMLDIGGTHKIATARTTLTKFASSTLGYMFSGKHELKEHKGRIFIDRDGEPFTAVISYLRSGKVPVFNTKYDEIRFYEEMDFWQIPLNISNGSDSCNEQEFDSEWCANTLSLELSPKIVCKDSTSHGIVFCKLPFDYSNNYVDFKVTIDVPSRTKSHLFIGVVDKEKYKKEYLTSTFWKDSPASFYWDVWNTKLIENRLDGGIQTSSGFGCPCEEYETIIGMQYDARNKSISFYKNGYLIGKAFKNVEPGHVPSIDLWFETGTIEILSNDKPNPKEFL